MHKTDDGLHPSPVEQQMLWMMNRARANPVAEGTWLEFTGDSIITAAINLLKVNIGKMKREFSAIQPAPPATFDRRLYEASRRHSEYMISVNDQTHDGQGDKLNEMPFDWVTARLSIFAACESGLQCHAALNIDYGVGPDGMQFPRGHRDAIMSNLGVGQDMLSSVGLAMVPEHNPLTANVGPYVFSAVYASANDKWVDHYNRFVVGTVWEDRNRNKQYDEGEGLNNVKVDLDRRSWNAVTGIAGGFSFPVTAPGNYTVIFSGGNLPVPLFRSVTVGEFSALVDMEISTPPVNPVPFATTVKRETNGSFTLKWLGGKGPYQVQMTNRLNGAWRNSGLPTMALTANLMPEGPAGFFRVVASE
ncbi:MAG: hypothetical protein V4726_07975 [Verrucomicrobiota bacterium]